MLGSAQSGHTPALLVSNIWHFKEFRLVWLTLVLFARGDFGNCMGSIHCIIFDFSEEHWKLHGYEMIRHLSKELHGRRPKHNPSACLATETNSVMHHPIGRTLLQNKIIIKKKEKERKKVSSGSVMFNTSGFGMGLLVYLKRWGMPTLQGI
jgi:hypothetical protein